MRNAPSVIYPVGRCRFHFLMVLLLAWPGPVVGALWWTTASARPGPVNALICAAGALLWVAWVVCAALSWWRAPTGRLQWDAQARSGSGAWRWHGSAHPQPHQELPGVELMVDLQSWMLLRLHGEASGARRRWMWLERARDPLRWRDLRRALQSHQA